MSWIITIGGKKYGSDYLGIKDDDEVKCGRNEFGQPRIYKRSINEWDFTEVTTPENYGWPSISIQKIAKDHE